jgi:phospholipase/carboxylesterase
MNMPELRFIHRWVPARQDGTPTLLLLHGTGGNEDDLLDLGRAVAPGWALLSPRGQVLEQGMPRFFRRRAEGVFDQADLQQRTTDLGSFIAAAATAYRFDPARVVALGFSNGANIAASLLLRQPHVLAGAALLHPMLPFMPDDEPDLNGRPILLTIGRADAIIPPEQAQALGQVLRDAGAAVTEFWHDGGHQIIPSEVRAAHAWLAKFG